MITLLIRKLMTGMPDLMASLGKNITDFNKDIRSIETDIRTHGEDLVKPLPQLFEAYADCSMDNGHFTCYIKMIVNH